MKSFTQLKEKIEQPEDQSIVSEAVSGQNVVQAAQLIKKYLERHTKAKFGLYPTVEQFQNSNDQGFGIRYFLNPSISKFDSVRFNWRNAGINMKSIASVDIFSKGKHAYHLEFDINSSVVKVLPFVKDFLMDPKRKGNVTYIGESVEHMTMINEANSEELDEFIKMLNKQGGEFVINRSKLYDMTKAHPMLPNTMGAKVFDALRDINKDAFIQKGKRIKLKISPELIKRYYDDITKAIGLTVKVSAGAGGQEVIEPSPQIKEIENEGIERVAYEQQLKDMRSLIKLVIQGISNAVFIGGRGGIGKTYNVEEVLQKEYGMTDGDQYFKNTGSISASGLYRLLFKHRKSILLFDDSDDVFKDQTSRNLLKAATDNKAKRKLAWTKKSSDIIYGDDFSDDDEEEGLLPSFFDFEGRIIFISNLGKDDIDPDGALRTRGFMIDIDPTNVEIYDFMRKIAPNIKLETMDGTVINLSQEKRTEAIDYLESQNFNNPNLRMMERALYVRAGSELDSSINWKDILRY